MKSMSKSCGKKGAEMKRMILTRENRDQIKPGMLLKDSINLWHVVNCWTIRNGRFSYVTLSSNGQTLYGQPLSKCYGMELIDERKCTV